MERRFECKMGSQKNEQDSWEAQLEKKMQESVAKRIAAELYEQKVAMEAKIRSQLEAEYASKCERWKEEQKLKTLLKIQPENDASLNEEDSQSQTPNRVKSDPQDDLVDALKEIHIDHTQDLDSETATTTPLSSVSKRVDSEEDTLASTLIMEEKSELSPNYVGRVIGKGGEMIRDLQARSGCKINVNRDVAPGTPCIISYLGRTQEDIDFAKDLVSKLCSPKKSSSLDSHTKLSLGRATMKQIQVPKSVIGRLIGKGGDMIGQIQSKSEARIQVDHSSRTETNYRQVTITGTPDAVLNAEQMILNFLNVKSIIGHKGAKIKDIQQRTSCDIKIDKQNLQISITGPRQGIESAKAMLHDVIEKGSYNVHAGSRCDEASHLGSSLGCESFEQRYCRHDSQGYDRYVPPSPSQESYLGSASLPGCASWNNLYTTPPPSPLIQRQRFGEYAMSPHQHHHHHQQSVQFPVQELASIQCPFSPQSQQYHGEHNGYYTHQPLPFPEPASPHAFPPQVLIPQWRIATTADGQTYYYNAETGETQWEKPAGM